jgi:hypothetical protein
MKGVSRSTFHTPCLADTKTLQAELARFCPEYPIFPGHFATWKESKCGEIGKKTIFSIKDLPPLGVQPKTLMFFQVLSSPYGLKGRNMNNSKDSKLCFTK